MLPVWTLTIRLYQENIMQGISTERETTGTDKNPFVLHGLMV